MTYTGKETQYSDANVCHDVGYPDWVGTPWKLHKCVFFECCNTFLWLHRPFFPGEKEMDIHNIHMIILPNNNVKTSLLNVIASIAYFTFISEWMAIHDTRLSGSLLASLRNWTSRTKLANKTVFIVTWLIKIISLLSLSLYLCLSL